MKVLSDRAVRTAAIMSTGTEILQGLYADTNARYLAEKLSGIGITVVAIAAAPDDPAELEQTFAHLIRRADIVLCTGGLGPTEDDVNRDVFARVLNLELELHEPSLESMRERFRLRGRRMLESNAVQAMVPRGCTVFQNQWGTAPGFFVPPGVAGEAALIALPGPPGEMIPMFNESVLPILRSRSAGNSFVVTRTVHTFGQPESLVNEAVRDLFRADPNIIYTVLAKSYGVDIRITAQAGSAPAAEAAVTKVVEATRSKIESRCIYGMDETTMQDCVGRLLVERCKTVTTAESCTGGLIAKLLTDVSGSSAYLKEGYVVYSNESKTNLLGVRPSTLESFGAVSEQTARELAEGALARAQSDYALSVTGIAGPTGATGDKPVGLTYIGLASRETETLVKRFLFPGDREHNRLLAALHALDMLRLELLR